MKSRAWLNFIEPKYVDMNEALWHQKCGAAYVRRYLQIKDKTIINAIAHHVNGSNDPISKIVNIADKWKRQRN